MVRDRGARSWCARARSDPLGEGPVAGHAQVDALVGGGEEAEEQLAAGRVEGGNPNLIDDDQTDAKQVVDDFARTEFMRKTAT